MSRFFRQLVWQLRRRRREAELREELEFHLEGDVEEREAAGAAPQEARNAALREFGNLPLLRETTRGAWGWTSMEALVQDLRHALRAMKSGWMFTLLAVGSLALGIGANTALFSIARSALFAELSVPDPSELVAFQWVGPNNVRSSGRNYGFTVAESGGPAGSEFSLAIYEQLRAANETLADLAAFAPALGLSIVSTGGVDAAAGQYVSGNYHELLGIPAFRGRVFTREDDTPSSEPVVVLSHDYWERRFGRDPDVVGSAILINGLSFTVIGVTPPGAPDPGGLITVQTAPAVAMPLAIEARLPKTNQTLSNRAGAWWLLLMGRTLPGVAPAEVQANFQPVFRRAALDDWELFRSFQETAQAGGDDARVPELRVASGARGVYGVPVEGVLAIGLLTVLFASVLCIVCINLASLLLSRLTARQQEIVVRQAIGAGRGRIIRQLLTENLVLALAGGALGMVLAYVSLRLLPRVLPSTVSGPWDLGRMHWTVFAFALGASLSTVVAFALVPALRASRASVSLGRGDNRSGSVRSRLNKFLLPSEVALSLLLLVSAGLLVRTLDNLRSVAVGFDPENVLIFRTDAPLAGYDEQESVAIYERILEEVRSIPGVEAASLSGFAPLTGTSRRAPVLFPGREAEPVPTLNVHHEFFRTMRIPLLRGRGLTAADGPEAPRVAVVNETFARRFVPDSNPIGSRFRVGDADLEIVGVVADARFDRLRDPAPPIFYTPHAQRGVGSSFRTFELRTSVDPAGMINPVWEAVRRVDPRLPFFEASTYLDRIERTLMGERVSAAVTTIFGALALGLSMTGLFGLMSYKVALETREIGIRMALGAGDRAVLGAVMRESFLLVGLGILIGLAGVLATTPVIRSLLFGLAPHDLATIASVVVLTVLATGVAAYVPARRASRVDPMVAIRYE